MGENTQYTDTRINAEGARRGLRQVELYLEKNDVVHLEAMDIMRSLIDTAAANATDNFKNGPPSYKQIRLLKKHDMFEEGMTKEDACNAIDELRDNGWESPYKSQNVVEEPETDDARTSKVVPGGDVPLPASLEEHPFLADDWDDIGRQE